MHVLFLVLAVTIGGCRVAVLTGKNVMAWGKKMSLFLSAVLCGKKLWSVCVSGLATGIRCYS